MLVTSAVQPEGRAHTIVRACRAWAFGAALLCAGAPGRVVAQSIDSLTTALASISVSARSAAVGTLSQMPLTTIPSATRDALIALLEREATGTQAIDPQPRGEADETWGEYIIALSDLVRTFGDSRSLRGIALLGIQTSRVAKEYVASFGASAFVPLDEAWSTKPDSRPSVIAVWALMARSADTTMQVAILHRLLAPDDTFPMALAGAAAVGRLVALVPYLDSLAQSGSLHPIPQEAITDAATQLRPAFTALSASQLLTQYNTILSAVCLNATGALNGYCESTTNGLDNSTKHLLKDSGSQVQLGFASQARQEIQTVLDRTLAAVASGVLAPTQGIVLISGLRQVLAKIS